MRFEHRGQIIELWLVAIHHSVPLWKNRKTAKLIWEYAINGNKSCATKTGDHDEVLAELKKIVDGRIDDPDMKNIF